VKAMILAAGLGNRMRPLTDHTPKPLLTVAGKPLLQHHIERLSDAGFTDLVINVSHLGQQIIDFCGDGSRWGVRITISPEDEPLETAGGIVNALPLLGDAPFALVNGDVWTDYPFATLMLHEHLCADSAHLVLIDNPPQHPLGDFRLTGGRITELCEGERGLTYSGIGVYTPGIFARLSPGKIPLRPLLSRAIQQGLLSGEHYTGAWEDVGTPERFASLNASLE